MNTMLKTITKKICSVTLAAAMVCTVGVVGIPAAFGEETAGVTVNAAEEYFTTGLYTYVENEDGISITRYSGDETEITVPQTIDGKQVTAIWGSAFDTDRENLVSLTLPDGMKRIEGDEAFNALTNLRSFSAPDTIVYVAENTLKNTPWWQNQPEGVIYIGKVAVGLRYNNDNSSVLDNVDIRYGTEYIAAKAFCDVPVRNAFIPESVKDMGNLAFAENDSLRSVSIMCEKVGNLCFYECHCLETVNFSANLMTIGSRAFYNCKRLNNLFLPLCLTKIDSQAFAGCEELSEIFFPQTLREIDGSAFAGTIWEESLPDGLIKINNIAYKYNGETEEITLDNDITSISSGAFALRTLKKIILPDNLSYIGANAFSGSQIESIDIPEGVSYIGEGAFSNCTKLKRITIPYAVTDIHSKTFYNCTSLEEIVLPDRLKTIGNWCFYNCSSLRRIEIPGRVTDIGSYTFKGCTSLESIELPDTIKTMYGNEIFRDCTSLTYVKLPSEIPWLMPYTFYGCTSLKNVVMPWGLKIMQGSCFEGCTALELEGLPEETEIIRWHTFYGCQNLGKPAEDGSGDRYFSVPYSVYEIEDEVFPQDEHFVISAPEGSYAIEYAKEKGIRYKIDADYQIPPTEAFTYREIEGGVEITGFNGIHRNIIVPNEIDGKTVVQIGASAFQWKGQLKSICFGNGLKRIAHSAFSNCSSLQEVVLPNGIETIDFSAFSECSSLESINFPDSLTRIGSYAFWRCIALKYIELPPGLTEIENNVFSGCASVESITIPENVSVIKDSAFMSSGLKEITLNDRLEEIGDNAFCNCKGLEKVTIPASVKKIGSGVFSCVTFYNVTEITLLGNETEFDDYALGYYWKNSDRRVSTDLVIVAKGGSDAEKYAEKNGLVFRDIDTGKVTSYRVYATDLTLNYYRAHGSSRYEYSLVPVFTPENVTNKDLVRTSSDESIATVEDGKVKAVFYSGHMKTGTVTITATADNGISVSITFSLYGDPPDISSIRGNTMYVIHDPVTMYVSEIYQMESSASPAGELKWESDNTAVATVDKDGKVKAVGAGKATITGNSDNSVVVEYVITVEAPDIPVKTVTLNKTKKTIGFGETYTLSASITPSDAKNKKLTWTSSNTAVATVSGGKVTAKKTGTATITAKTSNGKKATCLITVKKAPSKVTLNKTKKTIGVGEVYTLKATLPDGTASGIMKWTTGNSGVVTVKDGVLTAKKTGTATITVKTFNGKTATCLITVKKAPSKVTLNKTKKTIGVGEVYTLKATLPDGTASGIMKWTTSNSGVVTVKDGVLTAKKTGTATITVKTFNGKTATCLITVRKAPSKVTLSKTTLTIKKGGTYTLKATLPSGTASGVMKWTTGNSGVVTVKDGKLTAKKAGTATITVKTFNGKTANCRVTVK